MAWVYILRGSNGRHYIGSTINLERRLSEHRNGGTHTTQRLAEQLKTVAVLELETIEQARILERQLKAKKNPKLAIAMLPGSSPTPGFTLIEQPREPFGYRGWLWVRAPPNPEFFIRLRRSAE
jgi:predicted GIY-YIG superfamily endonuclease